jgi:ribokinase
MSRVAVVGQVVVDEIYMSAGSLEGAAEADRIGGKGFNIAAAASRLGADVEIVTAVGNDGAASAALDAFKRLRIGTRFVSHCGSGWSGSVIKTPRRRSTPIIGRLFANTPTPENVKTPRVRLTEGRYGEREVRVMHQERIAKCYRAALRNFDAADFDLIIFTLEFDDDLLVELADALRGTAGSNPSFHGPLIACNPAPRRDQLSGPVVALLNMAQVITPNRYEAEFLLGLQTDTDPRPSHVTAMRVAQTFPTCSWSVVTYGSEGWAWWCKDPSPLGGTGQLSSRGLIDKVGASDVFTAALCLLRLVDATIEEATTVAGAAARLAVSRGGGAETFPTLQEVITDLRELNGDAASRALKILARA